MESVSAQTGDMAGETSYPRTTDMAEMQRRCYPDTLAFYRYWLSKCGGRAMPARADLDPIEMRLWLPALQLVDVHENPRRLIYRLVGESEVAIRGFNPKGRLVNDASLGQESDAVTNYNIVIDQRRPLYDWSKIPHPKGYLISQECVLLPLSDDGERVNVVVTYGKVIPTYPVAARG